MTSAELAKLDELDPRARPYFEALLRAMQARGHDPFIGTVHRSKAAQAAAQASGATSAGQSLSWHMLERHDPVTREMVPASWAIDFRRRLPDGSMDKTTSGDPTFWRDLWENATVLGLRSLAYRRGAPDWPKILLNGKTWDAGHVEWRGGYKTLLAAVQAEAPHLLAA